MIHFDFLTDLFDVSKIKVYYTCSFYEPARSGEFTCSESDLDSCISLCIKQHINNVISAILSQYHTVNPVRTKNDALLYNKVSEFIRDTPANLTVQEFASAYLDTCAPYLDKLIETTKTFFYPQWAKKTKKLFTYAQFVAGGSPLFTGRGGDAKTL